jgi:ligand-binding sensor domain-containing protein
LIVRALFRVLVSCLFCLAIPISAQNSIQIEKLTTDSGLNFRHVNSIAQDAKGFMWFGTSQGLAKYDGNTFKLFNSGKNNPYFIPFEEILKLEYQSSGHTLWFIANHKLFALNLETEKLKSIEGLEKAMKGEVLDMVFDKKNNLWIVTDDPNPKNKKAQHLIKYDGKTFRLIKSLERESTGFTSVTVSGTNTICWTTINHGLTVINQEGHVVKSKILDTYNWYGYTIHYGKSFFNAKNQHYYFSESQKGVGVYQNLEFSHQLITHEGVFYNAVEDKDGGIWFTGEKELFYLNTSGNIFDYTSEIAKIIDFSHINHIYVDLSNLLWLGTNNGLVKVMLEPQNFEKLAHNNAEDWGLSFRSIFPLRSGDVAAMCETENQLYRINPSGSATILPIPNAYERLKDARFFVSDTISNKAYTVTNYLIEIDFNTNRLILHDEFSPFINETKPNPIIQLNDGTLLMGYMLSKLIRVDSETKLFAPVFKTKPEVDDIIKTLFQSKADPNIIWVGTKSLGVLKLNLKGKVVERYDIQSTPSISKNSVLSLLEFKEFLLVGTFGGGLDVLDLNRNSIRTINTQNGLCDNNVVSILSANDKEIIAATYNGLSRINMATNDIQNYFDKDGISHNEFNYPSAYKSTNGVFYFGGMNGITKFSIENLTKKRVLPALNFTQFEIFNQRKDTLLQITRLSETPVELSPYDINLKIDWSVPDYFNNDNYTYYTMMEGFENKWFFQGKANSIRYNQLPAGEYNLKVKGVDINGNESKAGLSIPIIVNPIFYKTWWFILLMGLFISGIIYSIFKYRLNQALAMERLRTRISSDLHDDVGSMLTGLAMQTEMLEMQATNPNEKSKLHKITNLSRSTISHMRDLVWSIDSRRDTIGNLVERMHELAEELLLPAEISYQIDVDDLNLQKKINFNCRRNLYLIYKEAINNLIKHSDAKFVNVRLINNKGVCEFSIKDNGSTKPLHHVSGLGLANMKMRAENINANLKFDLENGFGIRILIPNVT